VADIEKSDRAKKLQDHVSPYVFLGHSHIHTHSHDRHLHDLTNTLLRRGSCLTTLCATAPPVSAESASGAQGVAGSGEDNAAAGPKRRYNKWSASHWDLSLNRFLLDVMSEEPIDKSTGSLKRNSDFAAPLMERFTAQRNRNFDQATRLYLFRRMLKHG
jgi:hypothetical protein